MLEKTNVLDHDNIVTHQTHHTPYTTAMCVSRVLTQTHFAHEFLIFVYIFNVKTEEKNILAKSFERLRLSESDSLDLGVCVCVCMYVCT